MELDSNFFCEKLELGEVLLNETESLHIIKSFRATKGDILQLCDGKGRFANAEILDPNFKTCKVLIKNISEQEKAPLLHLAVSCLSDGSEEEIVFHAAQLQLACIHLLRTQRSQENKYSNFNKLCRRLEAKSLTALKQSRKSWLTEIKAPVYFDDFLQSFNGNLIVCDKDGLNNYSKAITNNTAILSGPEGGFSPNELKTLESKNAFFLSLGNTRIRAATAPIFALAKIALN